MDEPPYAPPVVDQAAKTRWQITDPRCPLGLRVMAVCNFVVAALGTVAVVALAVGQDNRYNVWTIEGPVTWEHHLMILMRLAAVMTVFFSGLGYLRLRRAQGWLLGNGYALIALANTALYAFLLEEFGTSSLLWLPFPVITLILLNTTYRKSFVGGQAPAE